MKERSHRRRNLVNRMMLGLSGAATALAVVMLALIMGYTLFHGISFINLDIFTQPVKPYGDSGGGLRNEIFGTLILVGLGSLIALPVGLGTGIYLAEFGSRKVASTVRFIADILAGVPSIVVGVFVYALMVRTQKPGYSAISAGVALAIIMIPVIARTAEESLRLVPRSMREAALALGITRWRSVFSVIIPGALTGIITGIMLAVARIAWETAPVIFTALGSAFGYHGLDKPIGALPLQIYKFSLSPYQSEKQMAWSGAFLLVVLILVISVVVRWLTSKRRY